LLIPLRALRGSGRARKEKETAGRMVVKIAGVSELTLQVTDLDASERWYTENLGLPVVGRQPEQGFVWLKAGEWTRLGLWLPGERQFGDQPGAHVHFAMRVDRADLPVLAEELRAKGLTVEGPVHHDGKASSIYIKDPDGHLIEFFDYEPQKDQPGE
jgi:catechol 2,3-dioxygenase-like lactoylglutathione lyase family enzyme